MTIRKVQGLSRAILASLFFLTVPVSQAERLFVGILEMDSCQSILYDTSAFSRVADLPLILEQVQSAVAKNLMLPSLDGIATSEIVRIVQAIDPALPWAPDNPANVALIPLTDKGEAVRETFSTAYKKQTPLAHGSLFENPSRTNLPPCVAVAVSGRHLLTSPSCDALAWAWENRSKLLDAPPQSIQGTFRILLNPQRFADLLWVRSEKASNIVNVDKLIRDFDVLSIGLTLDGQALGIVVRGKPKKGSALDALSASWYPPTAKLWNALPDNAFFASLSACNNPDLWAPYLGKTRSRLMNPISGHAPRSAFTGERICYLTPGKDRQSIRFVQIEPVTNEALVRNAIQKLDAGPQNDLLLTHAPQRQAAGLQIETYTLVMTPSSATDADGKTPESSALFTLLSLFLKKAVLETAVTDGYLITVIGTPHAIDDELQALNFPDKPLNLHRRINGQDPALKENLDTGASLHIASLIRQIVSLVPDVKPEHLRLLPQGGDGATFGISMSADTLTASLRFHANEIATLQRINRDGREVLQELFFQMFAKQMMDRQVPPEKQ